MASPSIKTPRPAISAVAWWLAAGTFIAGMAVGAIIVGLLSEGSPEPLNNTANGPTTAATSTLQTPLPTSSPAGSGQVTVNQACVDAVSAAQDAFSSIDDIAEAARQLDVSRLDEIVRRLQPLQTQLSSGLDACNITATVSSNTTPSTSAPTVSTRDVSAGEQTSSSGSAPTS